MAKARSKPKAATKKKAATVQGSPVAKRSEGFEPFEGDKFNAPGVRCKVTGVVIQEGPEFQERKDLHAALHHQG